jgi:hypothetical protein
MNTAVIYLDYNASTQIDTAVAAAMRPFLDAAFGSGGLVPDGLFVGHLKIVDVQQLARPSGFSKARQQGLFLSQGHLLALATAAWLASQRLEPAVVIGHVGPVHRAQRHSHRFRDHRLRHSALAQQHHLDTLTLLGVPFSMRYGNGISTLTALLCLAVALSAGNADWAAPQPDSGHASGA